MRHTEGIGIALCHCAQTQPVAARRAQEILKAGTLHSTEMKLKGGGATVK
jgi:hypothetical protein